MPVGHAQQYLRARCSQAHRDLEQSLPFSTQRLTLSQYCAHMQLLYAPMVQLEARLQSVAHLLQTIGVWVPAHCRAHLLAQDLLALGQALPLPDAIEAPSPLHNVWQGLGLLYVLQGSTLGGQVIVARLQRQLGLSPPSGCTYFYGHGSHTRARWLALCSILEANLVEPHQQAQAADAALGTFAYLRREVGQR